MASSFLEMKAKEQAQKLEKKYGSSAYGGTTWLNEQITGKKKKKKKEEEEDIAPVKETTTKKTKDDRTWFQKSGLWGDGYQFGDVSKAIIAGSTDLYENVATGVIGMGEKIVDATVQAEISGLASSNPAVRLRNAVVDLVLSDEEEESLKNQAVDFIAKDLYDERKIAKKLITAPVEEKHGIDVETASVFGDKTDSLAQSAGQLGVTTALSAVGVPFWAVTGLTAFGGEVEQAYNEGATVNQATLSGLISAGAEILTEKIGGISFGGKTLTDALTKRLTTGISSKVTKTLLKFGLDATAEGGEEILSGIMSALGQKMTYQEDKELNELFSSEDRWESFIGGFVLGGGSNVTGIAKQAVTGEDIVTGLSKNEQKVVDQLYNEAVAEKEKNGEKLTLKAKEKIFDDIVEQMDKGYIDTADIERVLGGEEYKTHTETLAKEKSMQEEYDKLFNMKDGDKSDADIARQAELKKQLDDLKKTFNRTQMGENVRNMVKGDRLVESYNEAARRYQAFEVDPDKYKGMKHEEAARKSVESAVALGVNNTNRMHDLVDYGAKIAGDTGMTVTYTTNEKSKATFIANQTKQIAAIENIPEAQRTAEQTELLAEMKDILTKVESGKIVVDGNFVNGGIELNLDSKKPLNKLVGHELTHSLEGNEESYKALHDTLMSYAKSKKVDTDKLLLTYKAKYAGVKDADPEAEMIADMVGEYLFTDPDFVKSLSIQNRNVFQKLWDEIKYLCKVATAGSKEARELEKVKKAFEEAYRGESDAQSGTKFSLTGKNKDGIEVYETSQEIMDLTWDERRAKYLDVMKNEYRGRTAKFVRNGHAYYAKFDQASIRKPIYGDNRASKDGVKALIKAGADGDVFDLVENSEYTGSKRNTKTHTNADYFDYFVKTVQIDGKVFDLMADVEKEYGTDEGYVYTLALVDNKKNKASPALGTPKTGPVKSAGNASGDNVAQKQPGVKWSLSKDTDGTSIKSYAEIVDEQQELYQRENRLRERKREAENNPELLQAMDDYSNLLSEMKELLPKRRNGTATQAELDRIEEIKSLKDEYLKRVADIQENIGLNAIAAEEEEIRETSRRLRDAADEAWAREGAEKENIAIEKSGLSAPEYFRKKALKAFKTTTNFNEAGYLLPDGKMLNFSGGERNHRYRDHREIGEIYEATQGTAALNRFLNDGNIRIMAESPGIDLASGVEPTKEQYAALRRFINSHGVVEGQFFVDFSGTEGRRVGNYSYEGRVNADRVLNDIKYFYANGEVREQSDIGRFFSLSKEGEAPVRRRRSDIYGEDVKLRTAPDDVAPVADAENATVAEMETVAPDGYGARVEEIVEALSGLKRGQRKKFGGYSAGVYTRNGSDNITLSITMPDGTIVKDTIEGGKYWSNTQLAHEIASRIAESEGYAPVDESAPVEDIAPVAPVKEKAEAIRPKPQKEPSMARATPEEQARAQILTEEPEVPKQKGKNWQKLKREALDPGTVFETLALKKGNRELQARYSSIKRADKMAQRFMAKGNGSLDSIRKTVEQSGKTKQFSEYMYHMLNTDRMTLAERYDDVENKPVFGYDVTAEMSKGIATELEKANPEFKKWAQDVYSYMNTLREMMVENGVISAETAQLWQEQYPHYVPIRRAGKDGMAVNVPLDTGRTGINAPIKKATGGNSDILPMFDTMGQRTIQTFKAVAKNRFGVELMHTLGKPVETEAAGLDEIIDSMDTHEELIQKGEDGKSPTFTVFENGERVTFDITEEMYEAMQPAQGVSAFNSKALNKLNNIRRGLITEYNLMFTATNAIKDAQDVMINSQHPVKTYAAFPQAFKELLTGKGTYVTEYLDNGGEDLTYFDDQTKTFTGDKSTLRKVVGFPLDKISDLNNFIEKIPRLAEYIASRKDGRSIDVAMLDAARVTTDFSAGGHFVKMMNRNGFTFLNASVQGAVQQVRNIREAKYNGLKGWAQLAGKVVAAGLPAMLLNHLLWDDDEEYAELSDYVKQNYYIVGKFDDGKFVRIPKGRTMAVIQSAFQQMENLVTGNDEVDLAAFGQLVVNNLAPSNPLDNNLIAPIAQAIGNRTWYGEDLVPTRLQDLPSREQHDESTDSLSKWLGEKTGLSPYKINYVLDQYSGFVGDTLLPMLTPEAENGKDTFAGNMIAPWVDKFTTDSVFNNQNVSDFYDKKDELTITANGMNATDDDILASKYMNSVNAELGKLYAAKREIQNDTTLSDSEKYEAVRDIQSQIVELTKQSLDTYDDISYQEPHRGYDEDIAVVGGKYFKQNEEGEWAKMDGDAVLKYQITSSAGDSNYATDGVTSYYWYEPGEDSTAEAGWRKVTDEQLEKQKEVTKALGISAKEYWGNKDEYDFAYKYPENYAVSKAVGGYDAYRKYSGELYDIKADKDKNGKSISGSRKDKVVDYINGLDIDYYEKLILFKSEYTADDTYNYEIIEYLNGREDISYQDMVTILRKLGFTVDSRGNVTW